MGNHEAGFFIWGVEIRCVTVTRCQMPAFDRFFKIDTRFYLK